MVGESGQAKGSDGIQVDQRVLKTHMTEAREGHLLGKDIKKVAQPVTVLSVWCIHSFQQ